MRCFENESGEFHRIARKGRDLNLKIAAEVMKKPMEIIAEHEHLDSLLEYIDLDCIETTFDIAHATSFSRISWMEKALNGMIINCMRRLRKMHNVH